MKRIEEVTLLYEISKALNKHLDLRKSLYDVVVKSQKGKGPNKIFNRP
ncbi:MAG: hypothetical protein JRD93_05500 [Deltaproteobacteria bacterium]|nr:hypothetical protein [Deltaproteobacteria bacterium]MBW2661439.1 hypothetical protein [Deltaproteobacteria bacterium]